MPARSRCFAYRRPRHLERTLEALRANPEASDTPLYIFSDGRKDEASQVDVDEVAANVAPHRRLRGLPISCCERRM